MTELALAGGRRMSYGLLGAADGPLVVVLDGPGSRGLANAAAPIAAEVGVRLAAPDRAGWGTTTPAGGRGYADWPADHAALLDELGAESAGILSQSGGTPFALAAAAALPERVRGIALLGAVDIDLSDAGRQLRSGVRLSKRMPWLLRLGMRSMARSVRKNPERVARNIVKDAPPADAKALEEPEHWALHVRATEEILSRPDALAHEVGLLGRPWGIDFSKVTAPLHFWTGELDPVHPPSHARRLAARLGDAPVDVVPGTATFGLVAIFPDALRHAAG